MPVKTESRVIRDLFVSAEPLLPARVGLPAAELSPRARELLDELESIFVSEGFAHLTVGQLAARLRCSRRTLYELAPSKDELVLVVLDRRLRRAGRTFRERAAKLDDPVDVLDALMSTDIAHDYPASVRFSDDAARHPAAQRLMVDHYRYAAFVLRAVVEEGIRRRRFRRLYAPLVAEIIDGATARLREPGVLSALGLTFSEAIVQLSALLRSGLVIEGKR